MTPSPQDDPKTLVSTDWAGKAPADPDLRVLDASWYLPAQNRDAKAEYQAAHIPGARFFDIDEISDQRSALPHMAPSAREVISRMRAMGVGDGHQVGYDGAGIFRRARVWWTFPPDGQDGRGGAGRRFPQVAGRGPRGRGHAPGDPRPAHDRFPPEPAGEGRDAGGPCGQAG